jgi:hypothetical protein
MDEILKLLENETGGKPYKSFRYCADEELRLPTLSYDDDQNFHILKERYGETDTNLKETKDITSFSKKILPQKPLFQFFLDGSRKTYKVDDIEINRRIFPIMAGQLGVACCERQSPGKFRSAQLENNLVMSLPTAANPDSKNPDLFFNLLKDKINNTSRIRNLGVKFSKVLSYKSAIQEDGSKYENLGIATIQNEMYLTEVKIVAMLYTKNLLKEDGYLMKDGSLAYSKMQTGDFKELSKIKNHYRRVVGISKLFNPELCKDRSGKSNAGKIANLKLFHRTPAYMHKDGYTGDTKFSIWYVRIREAKRTASPFAGIVKVEKILVTEEEMDNGLSTEEVDLISANVINERNPVCYGNDSRWANHLYPVFLTETFIKSKYLSDIHFLNLF